MPRIPESAAVLVLGALAPAAQAPLTAGDVPPAEPREGAAEVAPTMLQLADGRILLGFVEDHDPEALRFLRLDNGGRVRLPWSFLDPAQALELRERYGYVEHSAEELWVDGDRLTLADGSEVVGVVVNRTAEHLWVKTARSLLTIPKLAVSGATRTRVPALDLYTREELYAARRAELEAAASATSVAGTDPAAELAAAERELELARFCERIFDYRHAYEHYGTARARWSSAAELHAGAGLPAPSFPADLVEAGFRGAERKAAAQAEADEVARIDLLRARGQFDEALAACGAFPARFPDSSFAADVSRLTERVLAARQREAAAVAVRAVHAHSARLAREAARELTLEQALAWIDEALHTEVLAAAAQDLQRVASGVTPADVQSLWSARKAARYQRASYGQGTWLLGEERALAGLEEEDAAPAARDTRDAERQALEERIRRYLENQELALRARGKDAAGVDEAEEFWRQWSTAGRAGWILARYVEGSGQFEIREVRFQNCTECGGKGVREVFYLSANPDSSAGSGELQACPVCHNVGVVRRLSYR